MINRVEGSEQFTADDFEMIDFAKNEWKERTMGKYEEHRDAVKHEGHRTKKAKTKNGNRRRQPVNLVR